MNKNLCLIRLTATRDRYFINFTVQKLRSMILDLTQIRIIPYREYTKRLDGCVFSSIHPQI
jgi:hypothetical protein